MERTTNSVIFLFCLFLGLNILFPINQLDWNDDGIVLVLDGDFDSEEGEEEKEGKEEVEELMMYSEFHKIEDHISAHFHLSFTDSQKHELKIYLDVETPPPNMVV